MILTAWLQVLFDMREEKRLSNREKRKSKKTAMFSQTEWWDRRAQMEARIPALQLICGVSFPSAPYHSKRYIQTLVWSSQRNGPLWDPSRHYSRINFYGNEILSFFYISVASICFQRTEITFLNKICILKFSTEKNSESAVLNEHF